MDRSFKVALVAGLLAACGPSDGSVALSPEQAEPLPPVISMVFVGDVMPARDVAPILAAEGADVFADVRAVLRSADLAFGNLESALDDDTTSGELVAEPAAAEVLSAVGFDVMAVANNHAGDAGSVEQTATYVAAAGMVAAGSPPDEPVVSAVGGVRVATLAFDLTAAGWDPDRARRRITAASELAEILVVGLHGGVELLPGPDPALVGAVDLAAEAGADVVWAHGSHVPYSVELIDPDGDGRPTAAAYGLGNFLFDQRIPITESGLMVEVLADREGVAALRVGRVEHSDLRVHFRGWLDPMGDAVSIGAAWWALARTIAPAAPDPAEVTIDGAVVDAADRGPITGARDAEVVVAFRREFRSTAVNQRFGEAVWVDSSGLSPHLGLYVPETMEEVWVAGSLPHPIGAVAACDGALAVTYSDGSGAPHGGAGWHWSGFGFEATVELDGAALPGCVDVDGDGAGEPALFRGGVVGLYKP